MARARNVKPSFFTNDDLAELPFEYRLLFIGLWTLADREGRLEDRPKKIRMAVFPTDDVDVDRGLEALAGRGFILRYQVDGGRYIEILTFRKHQNPHHREPASTIPAPGSGGMDEPSAQGKPRAPAPSMGEASPGQGGGSNPVTPEAIPGQAPPDATCQGGSAVLIPDSPFLIPPSPLPQPGEPEARPSSSAAATAAEIAIECRSRGVRVQGAGDERVKAIAEQGVSIDTIRAACEEAKQSYPDEPVSIGLVLRILQRWARQTAGLQLAGAAPPQRGGIDDAAIARLQAKLEAEEAGRATA